MISINVDKNNKNYTSINGVLLNKNKDTILRCPSGKVGKIVIPSGVTRIENDAFFLCWSLTSISIPSTVRSIGDGAFCACSALMSINIPSGVTSIGKNAFSACSSLSSISIPSSVKSIGNRVFSDCDQLISVRMSSGVVSIGSGAFYNCSSLKSISIPSSVEIIGSKAFLGCRSLTSISIPSSVVSIGERAFINCRKLTSINIDENNKNYASVDGVLFNKNKDTIIQCPAGKDGKYIIPSSVVNIGERAFRGSSLTSISIPSSVTSIGDGAFSYCSRLKSISIPSSVTSIGASAFYGCSRLKSISIPSSVTSIGASAFSGCSSLTSISIPNGVTSIGASAFYGCSRLKSISIPSSVTSIGASAFSGCSSLTSISIPNGVTSIGASAFYGCSSLTSISIPSSVTSIGASAFSDCNRLTSINVDKNNKNYASDNGVLFNKNKDTIIKCPVGKEGKYIIPDGVTSIGDSTFSGCSRLTSISIPSSVTSIGRNAFSYCSLTSISIPDSVISIGDSAFSNCSSLTSISIPDGVISIGASAFSNCSSLTSISIPDGVISIGASAFSNCSSLTSISIPDGVTSIGASVFNGCSSLTSISIPDGVTSIGGSAFSNCSSLTSISIPDGVTSIGGYAFRGCSSLTSISIPNGVTGIGWGAFSGCSSLTSISIPNSVTRIEDFAFDGCSGLIIKGYSNSYAEEYAKIKHIKFEALDLVNKSEVSDEIIIEGESITIIGKASGGVGPYKYQYSSKKENDEWELISEFTDKSMVEFTPKEAGVYEIGVEVKDSTEKIVCKTININVKPKLMNESKVISTTIILGESITIQGIGSGGVGPYKYRYSSKNDNDGQWRLLKDYTTQNTLKFTPKEVGIYTISIKVMDSTGNIVGKTIQLTVNPKSLVNKSEISTQEITLGSSIKIQGIGSGGTGLYKYQYSSKHEKDTKWRLLKAYTDENTFEFTPKEVGIYEIGVRVKDSTEKVVCKIIKVTVNPKPLVNKSEVNSTTITEGESIKIQGIGSGGIGPYKYQYSSKHEKDTKWKLLKAYTDENTFEFTPKEAGIYEIGVRVKDSTGKLVCKIIKVTVKPKLINESKVSSTTITEGESITIQGKASGGIGSYKYVYLTKNEKDNKLEIIELNASKSTVKYTPKEAGIYEIGIIVMDSTGNIAYKTVKLTVNPKPLINKSEVSSQTITLGSSVTIQGKASGGVGPYKYRYTSKNEKDSKWTLLKGYTTENTLKFTPKEVGIYSISIRVMDSTGKIAYKIIQLTVKSK